MGKSFFPDGIDWEGAGYFAEPVPRHDTDFINNRHAQGWLRWENALRTAQRGDFSAVPDLLDMYRAPHGWVLGQTCAYLMGDAGQRSLFRQLALAVASGPGNYVTKIEFCDALAAWGSLTVVPTL